MNKLNQINNFGIRNFRSIDDKGVFFPSIKKINIFIGKNNSGKSNVLKFIKLLSETKTSYHNFPNNIENNHKRNTNPTSILFEFSPSELNFPKYSSNETTYIRKDLYNILPEKIRFDYRLQKEHLTFEHLNELDNEQKSSIINHLEVPTVRLSNFKADFANFFKQSILKDNLKFFENVIYIPDFRIINEQFKINNSNSVLNGQNIIAEIFKMQNPNVGEEENKNKFKEIEETVSWTLAKIREPSEKQCCV